jgi:hypothetical protein
MVRTDFTDAVAHFHVRQDRQHVLTRAQNTWCAKPHPTPHAPRIPQFATHPGVLETLVEWGCPCLRCREGRVNELGSEGHGPLGCGACSGQPWGRPHRWRRWWRSTHTTAANCHMLVGFASRFILTRQRPSARASLPQDLAVQAGLYLRRRPAQTGAAAFFPGAPGRARLHKIRQLLAGEQDTGRARQLPPRGRASHTGSLFSSTFTGPYTIVHAGSYPAFRFQLNLRRRSCGLHYTTFPCTLKLLVPPPPTRTSKMRA